MASPDPWPIIHTERAALAADLEPLTDAQWSTPSLCALWTVRDVVAHLTAAAKMTPGRFFAHFAGAGFRFNAMTAKDVRRELGASPAGTLAEFKSRLTATTHPPGPIDAMVGEAVLHGEDIRRPLGITRSYPNETLTLVMDFYRKSNLLIGGKKRSAGLTLRATDLDWSAGSGPEVSGPMTSLLLTITGRAVGLEALTGDGVATLRGRI